MDILSLKQERGAISDKMQAVLAKAESQKRDLTSSENSEFDRLHNQATAMGEKIERHNIANGLTAELNHVPNTVRPVVINGQRTDGRYSPKNVDEANFLRTGSKSGLQISNAMETGVDADGGYTVVSTLSQTIIDTIAEVNPILANARREVIDSNVYQQLYTVVGAVSGRIAEKGTRSETDTPEYARPSVTLSMQYAYPKVTEELALSSSFDIEGHVAREVVTAFDADFEAEMIAGDGVAPNQQGFIDAADSTDADAIRAFTAYQVSVTAAGATAITSDEVIDLIGSLPPRYRANAKLYASSAAVHALRKLKDGDSRYLLHEAGATEPRTFLGYEIVECPQMDALTTGKKPIAFGDMAQAYAFVSHESGLQVLRDPYTTPGYIKYYTRLLCGSGPMDTRALKVLQLA